jgi:hypothetical protein
MLNVHQKINAKGNAVTHWRSTVTPLRIMKSKKYEVNITRMLLPKQWKTNYQDPTKWEANY